MPTEALCMGNTGLLRDTKSAWYLDAAVDTPTILNVRRSHSAAKFHLVHRRGVLQLRSSECPTYMRHMPHSYCTSTMPNTSALLRVV